MMAVTKFNLRQEDTGTGYTLTAKQVSPPYRALTQSTAVWGSILVV
jgi:hypothetical protein